MPYENATITVDHQRGVVEVNWTPPPPEPPEIPPPPPLRLRPKGKGGHSTTYPGKKVHLVLECEREGEPPWRILIDTNDPPCSVRVRVQSLRWTDGDSRPIWVTLHEFTISGMSDAEKDALIADLLGLLRSPKDAKSFLPRSHFRAHLSSPGDVEAVIDLAEGKLAGTGFDSRDEGAESPQGAWGPVVRA